MDKHDTLLIASGSPDNRSQLRRNLASRYNLLEADNLQQLLLLLKQNISCIAALVLDLSLPEKFPREQLNREEALQWLHRVPGIVVYEGKENPELLSLAFSYGAADVIPLEYESYAMLRRIENVVDLHIYKQNLETMVEEQMTALRHSNDTMVDALSSIIECRSVESGQHILRIRHFTRLLLEEVARCCPEYQLTDRAVALISSAAALHDIGKIAIPDAILMKPGPLTPEEREVMKTHSLTGCRILETLNDMGDPEYLRYAHNICHYHHERWDGGGYPEGLVGEDIPICAQVVGLADVYDALTTKRVYKDAIAFDRAVNMILRGDCGIFSPKLLECFKHITGHYAALAQAYADGMNPAKEDFDMTLPPIPDREEGDSVERVRAKYFALLHYINGLLVEVDLDQRLLHLIYNPYPELTWLREVIAFEELGRELSERGADEESRTGIQLFFREKIQEFVEDHMRRLTSRFRFRTEEHPEGEEFEVTLLRINPIRAERRSVAILCRKTHQGTFSGGTERTVPRYMTLRCRLDSDFTLVGMGSHMPLLAGYSRGQLREELEDRLLRLVHPEDRKNLHREILDSLTRSSGGSTEFRVIHREGRELWIRSAFFLTIGPEGEEYLDCFAMDITGLKQQQDALTDELRRYRLILAQTENVLFEWDYRRDDISFSDTWETVFGLPPVSGSFRSAVAGGSWFHPDDLPVLTDRIAALENGSPYEMAEVRLNAAGGRYLWCRLRATAIRDSDGSLEKVSGIIINIDAEKKTQHLLQAQAERDSLTGLLNKHAAQKQAEEYLRRRPQEIGCGLLIIDLDDFKDINDRYGHLFGDAVLTKVAREIERSFRAQDIVGRIGGDEFMVLVRGISDARMLEDRCQRMLASIRNLFRSSRSRLELGCSVGIALSPRDGTDYYELFSRADQALYRAKNMGKNRCAFYEPETEGYGDRKLPRTQRIDSDEEPGLAGGNIVQYAFRRLYASKNVEASINEVLALIGQKTNVSRVYVFENSDDGSTCSNTYEWCNTGIRPEIHSLQKVSYETDIPGYADNFDEDGIFYCPDVTLLPEAVYRILEPQGIKSMLQCAIRENGEFRGYVGFDECVEQRMWTKQEISLLTYFSESLSMFLLRLRRQEKVQRQADELRSILDNQAAWIYVVEPTERRLKYVNARLRQQLPQAPLGEVCHAALLGRKEPCADCPMTKLGTASTACGLRQDPRRNCRILTEATAIRWEGEDAFLMTGRLLPDFSQINNCNENGNIPVVE